jgi:CTP:molybdopterin cytidylyltransferase MocA
MSLPEHPGAPVAATLLAAGLGRRLGGVPKTALLIDGESLFERLVRALRQSGIQAISVVIGPYADTLLALARRCDVQVVRHSGPADELVASQRLAVHEHLRHQPGADLMLLVADLPLLAADDLRPLLRAWAQRPAHTQAQVPVVGGVRGHPVLLSWQAVQAVVGQPWPRAVRAWMLANTGSTQWLQVDRDACVTDLDTPDDLQALRSRLAGASIAWPKPP